MAAPDPLAGTPEEFTDALMWKERVEAWHSGGGAHFGGSGGGEDALVGDVDDIRLRGCLRYALGYNLVTQASDGEYNGQYVLRRTLPVLHPRWRELVCTDASATPFKPDSLNAASLKVVTPESVAYPTPTIQARAGFKKARVTLRFQPVEWELLEDESLTEYSIDADETWQTPAYKFPAEWTRFTTIDVEPRVETLSVDGEFLKWQEGSGNSGAVSNPMSGSQFAAPISQLLVKPDITITTHNLPHKFLFGTGGLLPRNVLRCAGKVSRYDWNGFNKGELLCLGAKITRKRWALRHDAEDRFIYSMAVAFSHFAPKKGFSGGIQLTNETGHNAMPWRGNTTFTAGDYNQGRWFLASRTGGTNPRTDPRLLPYVDVAQMWNPVENPFYELPAP